MFHLVNQSTINCFAHARLGGSDSSVNLLCHVALSITIAIFADLPYSDRKVLLVLSIQATK